MHRLILLALLLAATLAAQPEGFNYDESKVPAYELPDLLDGASSPEQWREVRRPEILRLFEEHVYGRTPRVNLTASARVFEQDRKALDGKAHRKQVRIFFGPESGRSMDLLLYTPADAEGPVATFLGLNFHGNHTTQTDPAIRVTDSWVRNSEQTGVTDNRALTSSRGASTKRWPVEEIIARGYGLATIYYGDIDPDFDDGFKNGVHALFRDPHDREWSSIGAWSWGLSRALDYLETDAQVDGERIAVFGHSRLGKTSLWAGAQDERFAMVISNDSGCGGAALSRRAFGETVKRINTSFPHWFVEKFAEYNDNEAALPVDQHMLLALVAPRPLYVASAVEDRWADPRGEFLSLVHAGPAYELLGKQPLPSDEHPPVGKPVQTDVGYHIRSGKHDVTLEDWKNYLDFADRHLAR